MIAAILDSQELSLIDLVGLMALAILLILILYRGVGYVAHLAVWLVACVRGPEPLYGHRMAAAGTAGRIGTARTALAPRGKVFVRGELWDAVADCPVAAGERVEVVEAEGLTLHVRPAGEVSAGGKPMKGGDSDGGR